MAELFPYHKQVYGDIELCELYLILILIRPCYGERYKGARGEFSPRHIGISAVRLFLFDIRKY